LPTESVYRQVLPTAIGKATDPDETTDVEPLPELELALAELLELAVLLGTDPDPPVVAPEPFEPPHPARTRLAAAARRATAPAGWRRACALRFICFLTSIFD